jgi:2-polyprenyl-3-methyl-5-hydroxy-6-metoxy-1,4-benzoquinol methylase
MSRPLAPVQGPVLRPLDRMLRSWRIRKVEPFLRSGSRVLDVGCYDGALFSRFSDRIVRGVGVDPALVTSGRRGPFDFVADTFPTDRLGDERFDVVTLLAVLEHVDASQLLEWRDACVRHLAPGGLVVATVPSPRVDDLLHLLGRFHLIAGMAVHEHHGFDPKDVPRSFSGRDLVLQTDRPFELGLNNLFVFRMRETI